MNTKTRAALRGSITKWEKIVAGVGVDRGTRNCPLCQMFLVKSDTCRGCPVYEKTRKSYCKGSPYEDWDGLFLNNRSSEQLEKSLPSIKMNCEEEKYLEAKILAEEELEFLRSLDK